MMVLGGGGRFLMSEVNVVAVSEDAMVVNVVAVSKDGAMVASGGDDNMVKMWTIEGRGDQTMTGHSDVVKGLAFLPPIQPLTN
ncbi:hypothetical protein T484DRAFT_1764499 [Baffinella frigidus]|nr:hypothetical protein T484DRAFT_1764499 [Cryptophyta sp. CCMP2293]